MLREQTAASPERMQAALTGLRAYQQAARRPRPDDAPVIARAGRAALRDYGHGQGRPVVFIPSLINLPHILDLEPENSLLRWLATQGLRPMLVDWGMPAPDNRALSIAGHVETLLLPLIDALGEPPVLAGYCLGGTMALAAAASQPVPGLALIAAPWRFSGFNDAARADLAMLWGQARPAADQLGLLPMEVLQTAFWRLDPARTIGKFETFARRDPDAPAARAFVALEDWANDGPPLTHAAAAELVDGFFGDDAPGRGAWQVAGRAIDAAALPCPVLNIVSTTDRIVPHASAADIGERLELGLGHVGMIVGGRAREAVWRPLADWLFRVGTAI
jgi:polyhydroxyalkanoate synthase